MTAVITLTTDFGARDPYVAEMKAVILGLNPAVRFTDVSHEVAAHDVIEGALAVHAMVAVCQEGTIHVAVVDPGVGTRRRGLVVAAVGQLFVGPDNGVQGQVIHVDRFGNLVTSIDSETVERLSRGVDVLTVRIAGRRMPVVRTYGDLPIGGAGALAGSHGRLEVAVREGSVAARFRVRRGTTVRLSRSTASRTRARTRS